MKYYFQEMNRGERFNAASKARNDAETILGKCGYKYLGVETGINQSTDSTLRKMIRSSANSISWLKMINFLSAGDFVVIQFPWTNTILFSSKIVGKIKKKKAISVAVIHDLDSLRAVDFNSVVHRLRTKYEDGITLKLFDYVIVHNETMRCSLIERGFAPSKLIVLQIFDYLTDSFFQGATIGKDLPIIIAGNLKPQKTKYIYQLHEVNNTSFNLYGVNYEDKGENYPNIIYKGAFKPEELPNIMKGSFGLVWDGESIHTCKGEWGNYLKYNNPHKLSLYIASGLPVIVWDQSAMAEFVKKHQVGLAVSSISEINKKVSNISDEEYGNMCANVKQLSEELRNGNYLMAAMNEIEIRLNRV